MVNESIRLPQNPAILGVQRVENALEGTHVDLALPDRNAPIHDIAAGSAGIFQLQRRLELPQQVSGGGIERIDSTRNPGGVHHAIDDDRRRLHPTVGPRLELPGEAEPFPRSHG